jgi:hypothetical protein
MPKSLIFTLPLLLIGLIFLYIRSFEYYSNLVEAGRFLLISALFGLFLIACLIWYVSKKYGSAKPYLTEIAMLGLLIMFFSPLLVGYLNKARATEEEHSFTFIGEKGFYKSPLGMLKGEKREVAYHKLFCLSESGKKYSFRYKSGPYYPNTQAGETILLPLKRGALGIRWWDHNSH